MLSSTDQRALEYMNAVVQAKEKYETAQANGASTEDLLRLTAAASSARQWLSGHGYKWASDALGYDTANAIEARAWLTTVGLQYLKEGGVAQASGNTTPTQAVPAAVSGGGSAPAATGLPAQVATGLPAAPPLPPFGWLVWGAIGVGGLLAVKSLFGK